MLLKSIKDKQGATTMKKLLGLGLIIFLLPATLLAQGTTYKFDSTILVNESDTIATNVISAGQFIGILGHLDDDLFSASQSIEINGSIRDDALVAAADVTVKGVIGDMLVAAGETVTIDGEIAGDLFIAANEITLTPNAKIHGNVAMAGSEINIEGGTIAGWLRASGDELKLNGEVRRYVELFGDEFNFGENYRSLSSTSITAPHALDRANMGSAPKDLKISVLEEAYWIEGAGLLFNIWLYLSLLLTGCLLMVIFKQTTGDLYLFSKERYLRNTGIGALLIIGVPVIIFVLTLLILTIPISFILMMLYGMALLLGFLLVSVTLGTMGIRYFKSDEDFSDYFWGLALGMIIILLLGALPLFGWLINILLLLFGLGTFVTYLWQLREL